jgi:hypothetical protein
MNFKILNSKDNHCSFCIRNDYTQVLEISGNGSMVKFCPKCVTEFIDKAPTVSPPNEKWRFEASITLRKQNAF